MVPTEDYRDVPQTDAPFPSDSQIIAVSKNELLMYSPTMDTWEKITSDGASPVWSLDGQSVYYMMGYDLMEYSFTARASQHNGVSAASSGTGLLLSQPLPDGRLLAPPQPSASLKIMGGESSASVADQIEVTTIDRVFISPKGNQTIVAYGATTSLDGQFMPAVTALKSSDGSLLPLMQNCQSSAIQIAWSLDENYLAYPVHTTYPEIRTYNLQSDQMQVLIRLASFNELSGLSWSPDNKYIAFTQGDGISEAKTIWITSTDGKMRQQITEGLLPNWAPDGKRILYAKQGNNLLLEWHLLELQLVEEAKETFKIWLPLSSK